MNSTTDAFQVVTIIFETPGLYTQDDLVNITGFSKSKISRLCADACTAGFISKTQNRKTWTYSYGPVIQNIVKTFKK